MFKGFRDFLLRGNVIDLAVGVVIGVAFTAIVAAFTDSVLKPLINAITPPGAQGLGFSVVADKPMTYIDVAALISAGLNFVIVAAVVYFVIVLPMNKLRARRAKGEDPTPGQPTDVELLTEIRDLLRAQSTTGRTQNTPRLTQDTPEP